MSEEKELTNANLDKRIRLEWLIGLIFACGVMYALLSQAQEDTRANTTKIDKVQNEVHEVKTSVVGMERDVQHLEESSKRIENKQDHLTELVEELLRRSTPQ